MPIINYAAVAARRRERLFNNPDISSKNKQMLKKFLDAYDVSPAREGIFLGSVNQLLVRIPDLEKDMHNPEIINKFFKEIKQEYSPATIETLKNTATRLVRWLNKGTKPAGFLDIKSNKSAQKRNLEPKDMLTWEDGLLLAEQTASVQLKAALLIQLDAGLRPSEFIDLNYGDVTIKDDMVLLSVKGKTGQRLVWVHRAVPQFLRWYEAHPTKRKNDPLWLLENIHRSHRIDKKTGMYERYTFGTIQLRFNLMKEKAGLDKPIDFYNLRHSSCYLDKIDNVPNDLAAEKHGHSVEFYVNTYGRLDIQDKLARVRSHYGNPEEKKLLLSNQRCSRCKAINEPEAEFCVVCGVPLSAAQAAKLFNQKKVMDDKIANMETLLKVLVSSNPKLRKSFEEALALQKEALE